MRLAPNDFRALSKDHILVAFITQNVLALAILLILLVALPPRLLAPLGIFFGLRALLDALDLLQPEELLAIQLVELGVDVLDRVLRAWDDDVLTATLVSSRSATRLT